MSKTILNIPIYPLTYVEHLKLKYESLYDLSNQVINLVFDGKSDYNVLLERKMLDIYHKIGNYDVKNGISF